MGWVVNAMPRAFTRNKDPVPIVQEDRWILVPVWTGAVNLARTGIRYGQWRAAQLLTTRLPSDSSELVTKGWINTMKCVMAKLRNPQNRDFIVILGYETGRWCQ